MPLNPTPEKVEWERAYNQLRAMLDMMFDRTKGNFVLKGDPSAYFRLLEKISAGVTVKQIGEMIIDLNRQMDKAKKWIEEVPP